MKTNWKDKCKCGHSRYLHEIRYAGDIIKLEGCRICACLIFSKDEYRTTQDIVKEMGKAYTNLGYLIDEFLRLLKKSNINY